MVFWCAGHTSLRTSKLYHLWSLLTSHKTHKDMYSAPLKWERLVGWYAWSIQDLHHLRVVDNFDEVFVRQPATPFSLPSVLWLSPCILYFQTLVHSELVSEEVLCLNRPGASPRVRFITFVMFLRTPSWDVMPFSLKEVSDVSEGNIASIFSHVEIPNKQLGIKCLRMLCFFLSFFDLEYGGNTLLRNVVKLVSVYTATCNRTYRYTRKQTPWSETESELYRPSDRRLSAKLVPILADIGCHVVRMTDPYSRILSSVDRSCYFFF
jgi:hypothetical protein